MKYLKLLYILFCFTFLSCQYTAKAQPTNANNNTVDFNQLSQNFLLQIKEGQSTELIQKTLATTSVDILDAALNTNNKRLAFWVNIYNGYIQVILKEQPELYKDRGSFFKKEQIQIAGEFISFAKIEHGILRKSQWEYGLGMIRKWFPNRFERKLRVYKKDFRIHFALNCGAKDCPPVAIYDWERLEDQLNSSTRKFLSATTTYNKTKNEVTVTPLFSWFRGDFGCNIGIKNVLKKNDQIPTTKKVTLNYKNYDWTLDLENFIEL